MRAFLLFVLGGALMLAGSMQPAQAQQTQPTAQPTSAPGVYAVSYFSVAPAYSRKVEGILGQFGAATHKEDGNSELIALHETGRPGRFAIVEVRGATSGRL